MFSFSVFVLLCICGFSMSRINLGNQINDKVHPGVFHAWIGITLGIYVLAKNKVTYLYQDPCSQVQLEPKSVVVRFSYLRIANFDGGWV